jgi:hypothetical protein
MFVRAIFRGRHGHSPAPVYSMFTESRIMNMRKMTLGNRASAC